LTLEVFKEGCQAMDVEVNNFNIDDVSTGKTKPRKLLAQWCDANRRGAGVKEVMKQRGDLLKLAVNQGSLLAVTRLWHRFATGILCYPPEGSLPPRCPLDAVLFLNLFSNHGTASKYISYLIFVCIFASVSTAWKKEEVKMALKGLGKCHSNGGGGPSRVNFLLHQQMLRMLVVFYDAQGDQWASIQTLLCWECLLRVASEGTTVFAGCPLDAKVMTRHVPTVPVQVTLHASG